MDFLPTREFKNACQLHDSRITRVGPEWTGIDPAYHCLLLISYSNWKLKIQNGLFTLFLFLEPHPLNYSYYTLGPEFLLLFTAFKYSSKHSSRRFFRLFSALTSKDITTTSAIIKEKSPPRVLKRLFVESESISTEAPGTLSTCA